MSQTHGYQLGAAAGGINFHTMLTAIKDEGERTMGLFGMMSISASALSAERRAVEADIAIRTV